MPYRWNDLPRGAGPADAGRRPATPPDEGACPSLRDPLASGRAICTRAVPGPVTQDAAPPGPPGGATSVSATPGGSSPGAAPDPGTAAARPPGAAPAAALPPLAELHLWPHRSLPRRGFVAFLGATGALMCLPLVATLGTPVLWGLLPFLLLTLLGTWWAIECSYRSGLVTEELRLWPDRVTLIRRHPRTGPREWDANPHWVRVRLYHREGPVTEYVTLGGAGREVEIGAFLSEPERMALYHDLCQRFEALRHPGAPFPAPALRGA